MLVFLYFSTGKMEDELCWWTLVGGDKRHHTAGRRHWKQPKLQPSEHHFTRVDFPSCWEERKLLFILFNQIKSNQALIINPAEHLTMLSTIIIFIIIKLHLSRELYSLYVENNTVPRCFMPARPFKLCFSHILNISWGQFIVWKQKIS